MHPKKPSYGQRLSDRARKGKEGQTAGSDGFRLIELAHLPKFAWDMRARVLLVPTKVCQFPDAYYTVNTPSIPKKDKANSPVDFRLLAVFCGSLSHRSGGMA